LRPRKLVFSHSQPPVSESYGHLGPVSSQIEWQYQTDSQRSLQYSSLSNSNSPLSKPEYRKPLSVEVNSQFRSNANNSDFSPENFDLSVYPQQYESKNLSLSSYNLPVRPPNIRSASAPNSPLRQTSGTIGSTSHSHNICFSYLQTQKWSASERCERNPLCPSQPPLSPPPLPPAERVFPSSGNGYLNSRHYSTSFSTLKNVVECPTCSNPNFNSNFSLSTRDFYNQRDRHYHSHSSKLSPNCYDRRHHNLQTRHGFSRSFDARHYDYNSYSYQTNKTKSFDKSYHSPPYTPVSSAYTRHPPFGNSFKIMSKQMFHDFMSQLKAKEDEGYAAQLDVLRHYLALVPPTLHWRLYLDIAEFSKRESHFHRARRFYECAISLQPREPKVWLEYAKMEEENGHFSHAERILRDALCFCPFEESIIIKCLKIQEKLGNVHGIRHLLGTYRCRVELNTFWKVIIEGALFEARQRNVEVARTILYILSRHLPWCGAIYVEGIKLEMRLEHCESCVCVRRRQEYLEQRYQYQLYWVFAGLRHASNYLPLYVYALSVLAQEQMPAFNALISPLIHYAAQHLSKELLWKLYLEFAAIEERRGRLSQARLALAHSVMLCPSNLRWRVWLQGARIELSAGNIQSSRRLLERALQVVPDKMKLFVCLEIAHLEEYLGNIDCARDVLNKAKKEMQNEWKVFLEIVLLEVRARNYYRALAEVREALQVHFLTGRLHALHIFIVSHFKSSFASSQSQTINDSMNEWHILKRALYEVPKAGEVWTEGARLAIKAKDFVHARRFLDFALEFTPQYGDSFVEYLRLELLQNGPHADLAQLEQVVLTSTPNYGVLWNFCKTHSLETPIQILNNGRRWLLSLRPYDPTMDLCFYLSSRNVQSFSNEEKKRLIFGWF